MRPQRQQIHTSAFERREKEVHLMLLPYATTTRRPATAPREHIWTNGLIFVGGGLLLRSRDSVRSAWLIVVDHLLRLMPFISLSLSLSLSLIHDQRSRRVLSFCPHLHAANSSAQFILHPPSPLSSFASSALHGNGRSSSSSRAPRHERWLLYRSLISWTTTVPSAVPFG